MNIKDFSTSALDPAQLARACGITRRTVYEWLAKGTAPRHERFRDGRVYFYRDEALAFAAAWRQTPAGRLSAKRRAKR